MLACAPAPRHSRDRLRRRAARAFRGESEDPRIHESRAHARARPERNPQPRKFRKRVSRRGDVQTRYVTVAMESSP
jgi:hypothetical protein